LRYFIYMNTSQALRLEPLYGFTRSPRVIIQQVRVRNVFISKRGTSPSYGFTLRSVAAGRDDLPQCVVLGNETSVGGALIDLRASSWSASSVWGATHVPSLQTQLSRVYYMYDEVAGHSRPTHIHTLTLNRTTMRFFCIASRSGPCLLSWGSVDSPRSGATAVPRNL
jgi:hypothetical protein